MATLTPQAIGRAGIIPSFAAAAGGGDAFANDGKTYLHVKNADSGSHSVTVKSQAVAGTGLAQADVTVAVAAGVEKIIGPFPVGAFNDSTGLVQLTYTAVTSVTVGVFQLPS